MACKTNLLCLIHSVLLIYTNSNITIYPFKSVFMMLLERDIAPKMFLLLKLVAFNKKLTVATEMISNAHLQI